MIQSFANKETEQIWNQIFVKNISRDIQRIGLRKLIILHRAQDINDLRIPPGNRLEALSGDRIGQHSIRINGQWRICFYWNEGSPSEVEIIDYH
ncbi:MULTISPECIES: type II toxin-antitoxin system RelE/ParE family toxin [unclassified Oceanispirochaeta]|uniref:type II toxin-antitoxin system RelE/ParE family toxin n=1 Tax=unclassified Oceanispirochaeta TaxID=2635722 RepID=UPI000E08E44A|nr:MULTISPECIES: type II toxin-antitoxin system RelE/ParE family toxin [unclassified Oceanispirochaeta]MBF9014437.1 type II toxin-antitoxin system RelE/ParE family toxin [Oceanispirochaeta sp. M2]NPD74991.1 type II toxin-antitoxin system RelE/ParE family toxin [Oceanispirochaeta sp. M1]RDG29167.1 type II toxin-antitoxin system RelE/ParE family toxin [Oceanispirochaeta sp. M1]